MLGENAEIVSTCKGQDLVGTEYEPLFELPVNFGNKKGYRVVADDYVSLEDGTGIVHIAPAFGEDDSRVGKKWELPFLQLVNASGHLIGGTPWDGLFVKEADKPVLDALVSARLIDGDDARFVRKVSSEWVSAGPACRVTIRPIERT